MGQRNSMSLLGSLNYFMVFMFLMIFSKDNGRVTMEMIDETICKVEIKQVEFKDGGIWKFTTESGLEETKKFAEYSHNVTVTDGGK